MQTPGDRKRAPLLYVLAAGLIPILSYGMIITLPPMCDDFFGLAAISGNMYRAEDNFKVDNVIDQEVILQFPQVAPWWTSPDAKLMFLRPLTRLLGWAEYHVWGMNMAGYLFVNVLVHALSCVFLFLIARRLFRRNAVALAGTLIFSSHVFNLLVISWMAEGASLFSLLWANMGIYSHVRFRQGGRRRWEALAWVLFVLAFLTRESGALYLGVYFLYDLFVWRRETPDQWPGFWRTVGYYVVLGLPLYVFIGWYIATGRGVTGHYTIFDEGLPLGTEVFYVLKNVVLYLVGLLFFIPSFHEMNMNLFHRPLYWLPLIGLVVLAFLLFLPGLRRRVFWANAYPFLFCWMLLAMLPTVSLLTQNRYLYGATGPFGLFMAGYLFEMRQARGSDKTAKFLLRGLFYVLLAFYIVFPVTAFWTKRDTLARLHSVQGEIVQETMQSLQGFEPPVNVFFVNLPNPILTFAMQFAFDYYSEKGLVRAFPLTIARELPEIRILGEKSLVVTSRRHPFLESEVERLFMTELPDRKGFSWKNMFFTATIEDVREGHIYALRFDFTCPISAENMRFFYVRNNHAYPLVIPPDASGVLHYGP